MKPQWKTMTSNVGNVLLNDFRIKSDSRIMNLPLYHVFACNPLLSVCNVN